MTYTIKLTSKGQITLPKEIRDKLMLRSGDYLEAQVKDRCILLTPRRDKNDSLLIMEYAEQYAAQGAGVKKARELTKRKKLNMTEYVRKSREEN